MSGQPGGGGGRGKVFDGEEGGTLGAGKVIIHSKLRVAASTRDYTRRRN